MLGMRENLDGRECLSCPLLLCAGLRSARQRDEALALKTPAAMKTWLLQHGSLQVKMYTVGVGMVLVLLDMS